MTYTHKELRDTIITMHHFRGPPMLLGFIGSSSPSKTTLNFAPFFFLAGASLVLRRPVDARTGVRELALVDHAVPIMASIDS